MKIVSLVFAMGLAAVASGAPEAPTLVPPVSVSVPSPLTELAAGYAAAIKQMSLKSLVIFVKGDGKVVGVRGIRAAKALNGVLLVTFSAGDMMAIAADQIVMVTDGARVP